MWTTRATSKVPLVSGSRKASALLEAVVGALRVACLVSAINNEDPKTKPEQKYNQYLLG